MVFRRFYLWIIVQVLLMLFVALGFGMLLFRTNYIMAPIHLALLLVIQVTILIRYINKFNFRLKSYLEGIALEDWTGSSINLSKSKDYSELNSYLQQIAEKAKQAQLDKNLEHNYHQFSIEHVDIGLVSFDENYNVKYINKAAKTLLDVENINKLDDLQAKQAKIYELIPQLKPGQAQTTTMLTGSEMMVLSLRLAEFKLLDEKFKLVSFQNIKSELDEKELDSWQKLIKILRHEIMNSVGPITSATTSLMRFLSENGKAKTVSELNDKLIADSVEGLKAIDTRGKGLMDFVQGYRNISSLPEPRFANMDLNNLLDRIAALYTEKMQEQGIVFSIENTISNANLIGDEKLIEQVLINLLKNAMEAVKQSATKEIVLQASQNQEGKISISVYDTGQGIAPENLENIFVPFFTTKETGSGIGLSLSRQIMSMHKGSISVNSEVGKGSCFVLGF